MRNGVLQGSLVLVVGFVVALCGNTLASDITITDFRAGSLSWTNVDTNLYYTVEFLPNLTDALNWQGNYRGLQDIQSTEDVISVPIGVFWRVVGHPEPRHTRLLSFTNSVLEAGYYEATVLRDAEPNLDSQNIRAGVDLFGVIGTYDQSRLLRLC